MDSQRLSVISVAQVIIRAGAAALDVVTLGFLVYCTARFQKTFGIGYGSAVCSVFFNVYEIVILVNRNRGPQYPLFVRTGLVDFLIMVLCVIAGVMIGLENVGTAWEEGAEYPGFVADPWRMDVAFLQVATACIHGFLMISSCVICCRDLRR